MTKGQKHIKRICADICNKLGGHAAKTAREVMENVDIRPIIYYGVDYYPKDYFDRSPSVPCARLRFGTDPLYHEIYFIYKRDATI